MYEAHFGLRERPFSIAPDPRYLYLSQRHRDALAHLLYGVGERGGFVQLTGAIGTGKTTLTRALIEQLPDAVDLAFVLNPSVTAHELLLAVCEELRVPLPARPDSTPALMNALRDYLLDAFARGRHTVVLIDEAQNLSPGVLEQIRLLTNLETNREKLLQIILVGQPELRTLLARPELRQVAQRVTARFHLGPLTLAETREYIRHRIRTAGGSPLLFSTAAIRAIHRRAGGVPRLINIICDRALLGAYAGDRPRVTLPVALRAAREVEGREPHWGRTVALGTTAGLLAALALMLAPPLPVDGPSAAAAAPAAEPAPADPPPLSPLQALVADGAARPGPQAALADLFAQWGAHYRPDAGAACTQALAQGLRCDRAIRNWAALLGRDLPAVLELTDGDAAYSVLLTGVAGAEALLAAGERTLRVPQALLVEHWSGAALALWRPPAEVTGVIQPGSVGPAVAWLARQLDRIEARAPAAPSPALYDDALRRRVMAFQRSQGLAVDGVVGENTLLHLVLAVPGRDGPTLRAR